MSGFNFNDILNTSSKEAAAPVWIYKQIPLELIIPSAMNKYRICDIEELAESIEVDGLMHNLVVRKLPDSGNYELISGERRYHALQLLVERGLQGYATAPCKVEAEQSDVIAEIKLLRANATARNLTDAERVYQTARYKELLIGLKKSGEKLHGRVREIIARELNVSPAQVGRMESIQEKLIPAAREEFEKGNINMTAAYEASRLPVDKQAEVVVDLKRGDKMDIKAVKQKRAPRPAAPVTPPAAERAQPRQQESPPAPPPVNDEPQPRTHELKTWPEAFDAVAAGLKPWEYRNNDRGYAVGDVLRLRRYDPERAEYTGETLDAEVIYIMQGGAYGIPDGYVIMSIASVQIGEG